MPLNTVRQVMPARFEEFTRPCAGDEERIRLPAGGEYPELLASLGDTVRKGTGFLDKGFHGGLPPAPAMGGRGAVWSGQGEIPAGP
ncbi:hypothetical protein OG292_17700 [Streptomyces sp. NBC_01511]|uniref:hypothetical protein n=1 Tax=unclassified Streptomyces TaxID=2593676 RepID=UPI003864C5C6